MNKKDEICERISKCCDDLGEFSLLGVPLESADPRFLDVRESSLDEHVAIQPSALAFLGKLRKDAIREVKKQEREYEKWKMDKYTESRGNVDKSGRVTKDDIQAQMVKDNRKEIDEWEDKIMDTQRVCDLLDVYYEAWKQKAFSLNVYANITADELFSKESIEIKTKISAKKDQIRDIIRKKHGERKDV